MKIKRLNDNQYLVLNMILDGQKAKDLAIKIGVTSARIHQIKNEAMRKIRANAFHVKEYDKTCGY